MKHFFLLFVLSLAFALPSHGSDEVLTAQELAHHLGVQSWTSKMKLQDANFHLQVLHIVNGKIAGELLSGGAFATDREFTRVSILASQTSKGLKLSMMITAAASCLSQMKMSIPIYVTIPLPQTITEGDYILGGEILIEKIQGQDPANLQAAANLQYVQNGLLLRVSKESK